MEIQLSEKERQLIRLKSEGKTLNEIAKAFFTNRENVKWMFNGIYKKTGCSNGPHLVAWAYQNSILEINC